jgi:hypothetical protein
LIRFVLDRSRFDTQDNLLAEITAIVVAAWACPAVSLATRMSCVTSTV